jgi:hypothetical protein
MLIEPAIEACSTPAGFVFSMSYIINHILTSLYEDYFCVYPVLIQALIIVVTLIGGFAAQQ